MPSKDKNSKTHLINSRMDNDVIRRLTVALQPVVQHVIENYEKDPSTQDTPRRIAEFLAEFCQPFPHEQIFGSVFENREGDSMVVQAGIPFRMICEHHFIPATGIAHVGYIPHDKVIGLSKLARLVDAVGVERPSLQEHIAHRILTLLRDNLSPRGVMVVVEAEHGCMACRGIKVPGVATVTSNVWGVFRDVVAAREEFLELIKPHRVTKG